VLVQINFANILVAIILLLLGFAVFTRHRIASLVVGGFLVVLAALSIGPCQRATDARKRLAAQGLDLGI